MPYYNVTTVGTTPFTLASAVNTWTGGLLGLLFLFGIMLVAFITVKYRWPTPHAVIVSSFAGMISSYFLNVLGWLIDPVLIYIPTGIFLGTAFLITMRYFFK
jgi:hypothetical protein